jgi:hypothetical protein
VVISLSHLRELEFVSFCAGPGEKQQGRSALWQNSPENFWFRCADTFGLGPVQHIEQDFLNSRSSQQR